jgi:hypothetical protein
LKKDVEIWRDIIGYEGLYQVSTMGRVKNLKTGKILKPVKNKQGYMYVCLSKNGQRKTFKVHRLVAQAFLKPVPGKDFVNHLDEDKTNNHYSNLEYCTAKENLIYNDGQKRRAEKKRKPVQAINPDTGEVVVEYPSVNEAGRNGYSSGNVSLFCRGKYEYKTYRGLIWRYK